MTLCPARDLELLAMITTILALLVRYVIDLSLTELLTLIFESCLVNNEQSGLILS